MPGMADPTSSPSMPAVIAEYDRFSRAYQKSKALPFRHHAEEFMLFRLIGDLDGRSVLDLACGEGHYTRMIRRRGAGRVVGVDLSAAMFALANDQEAREPLGIEYRHAPAEEIGAIGPFDLVTAAYLLNCASSREQLSQMCRAIAANLGPGGRFVTINSNLGPGVPPDIAKYGWHAADATPITEGAAYRLTFPMGEDTFTIQNWYYSHTTYENVLREAGFRSIRWHDPEVSEEGIAALGADFWRDFREFRPIIGIECTL